MLLQTKFIVTFYEETSVTWKCIFRAGGCILKQLWDVSVIFKLQNYISILINCLG